MAFPQGRMRWHLGNVVGATRSQGRTTLHQPVVAVLLPPSPFYSLTSGFIIHVSFAVLMCFANCEQLQLVFLFLKGCYAN